MLLTKIQISNFRSIKELTLTPNGYSTHVLVGMNESGKSSVLRALSMLSPEHSVSASDVRIERPDDEPITEAYVRFIFKLSKETKQEIYESVSSKFSDAQLAIPLFSDGKKSYTLSQFCDLRDEGLFIADLTSSSKTASYWGLASTWIVLPNWYKVPAAQQVTPVEINNLDGSSTTITGAEYIFSASAQSAFPLPKASELLKLVGSQILEVVNKKLPKCIFWQYSEANLLPGQVNVTTFAANPDTCIPLRSMFELAGYTVSEIADAIASARSKAPHYYTNLLNRVAAAATAHIRSIWREYATMTIELAKNGDLIEPTVKDKQLPVAFSSRSDGFKRFVSFLLLISAKVRTDDLRDTLILVDEPEIALHPSGARNLRDELIEVGKTNYVFFSTHSIFMIDREKIDRHIIVEKVNEITECRTASKSLIQDEEVLFNAIGFSMFEVLHPRNVIFEGWRDKLLFKVAITRRGAAYKELRENLGLTHAEGVKDVKHLTRFLELGNRGCLIITDADNVAKQHKKTYVDDHGYGTWATYEDIPGLPKKYITAEDFLADDYIVATANSVRTDYPALPMFTADQLASPGGKLKAIQQWIEGADTGLTPHIADCIKSVLFSEKLTHQMIIDDYKFVIDFVQSHFDLGAET